MPESSASPAHWADVSAEPVRLGAASSAAPNATSLGLLRVPFVFTQDRLLLSQQFVEAAARRDLAVSLEELEELTQLGVLIPLFRVDDAKVVGRRIPRDKDDWSDLAQHADAGQVHDPAGEGFSRWLSFSRPADAPDGWWDGYYFSPWQLLELEDARAARTFVRYGDRIADHRRRALVRRRRLLALCALAPRHFSQVWGQASLSSGRSFDDFHRAQFEIDDSARLRVAGVEPTELRDWAELLLGHARVIDPLIDLWPLLRHADHRAWSKLRGKALLGLEHRVAAEVLLRAHEHLAEEGALPALPTLERQGWRQLLHDRITVRDDSADSLDRALGSFGLSPYPRVLLLIEGETERIHLTRLLDEFGLGRPHQVRVHVAEGSAQSPRMLANYVVSPRLGPVLGDRRLIEATPTALFIAMDPEGMWTADKLSQRRRTIQQAIRAEVQRQGAHIEQNELDVLVHVYTWGDQSYELANFTDPQLIDAIERLADEQHQPRQDPSKWRQELGVRLAAARSQHHDIKRVLGPLRLRVDKPRLAELLLPHLLDIMRAHDEPNDSQLPPVLVMLDQVYALHARLSGSGYSLQNRPIGQEQG